MNDEMIQVKEPQVKNIVNVAIKDKLSKEEIQAIAMKVKQTLAEYEKVRLYLEIPDFEGYTLKGFFEDLKDTTEHLNDFEKVAIVTEQSWIGKLGSVTDMVIGADIKYFNFKDIESARTWISA